ncbi:MAG: energy transducer TonB [Acidobacteriota bacterium]
MFEDSIFESAGVIHTHSRNWMLATFALNGTILLVMVLLPLLYPEALPHRLSDMLLTAPAPPVTPPPQIVRIVSEPFRGASQMSADQFTAPRIIPTTIYKPSAPEAPGNGRLLVMDSGPGGIPGGLPGAPEWHPAVVAPKPHGPVRISSGVAEGMLLRHVSPRYPPIALAMRMAGTVELQAVISKVGTVENLRVVSGPAVFQQASIDAIRQWRYRPYLLNGEPVEVETTISVIFMLDK